MSFEENPKPRMSPTNQGSTANAVLPPGIVPLVGFVQHYPWGKIGKSSLVAQLSRCLDGNTILPAAIDESKPYAELWFGAHPNGPAQAVTGSKSQPLGNLIAASRPAILGAELVDRFGGELPFLVKVLSVDQPLSIQAHPDEARAAELHQEHPEHYPDPRHKPEVAIPLTPLTLLYGFRTRNEIVQQLVRLPELVDVFGEISTIENEEAALKHAYSSLLGLDRSVLAAATNQLTARLRQSSNLAAEDTWFLRLAEKFPDGDVGLFSFYLLNIVTARPGEAIFTEPNTLHSYLDGDLVEVMSNSDNVIRAGLTGKFQDRDTLLSVLRYRASKAGILKVQRTSGISRLGFPCREFAVDVLTGPVEDMVQQVATPQILVCLGDGEIQTDQTSYRLSRGSAVLVSAAVRKYQLKLQSGELYRATVPN